MKESSRRTLKDRRQQPTPALGRFILRGRRRAFRRQEDRERGGYVDLYSPGLFFILILIVGLNVLDAFFTMIILNDGGWEANPVVRSVIQIYGDGFWIWKFFIVTVPLILLCLHSQFRQVRTVLLFIGALYLGVVLYQISLMFFPG